MQGFPFAITGSENKNKQETESPQSQYLSQFSPEMINAHPNYQD